MSRSGSDGEPPADDGEGPAAPGFPAFNAAPIVLGWYAVVFTWGCTVGALLGSDALVTDGALLGWALAMIVIWFGTMFIAFGVTMKSSTGVRPTSLADGLRFGFTTQERLADAALDHRHRRVVARGVIHHYRYRAIVTGLFSMAAFVCSMLVGNAVSVVTSRAIVTAVFMFVASLVLVFAVFAAENHIIAQFVPPARDA